MGTVVALGGQVGGADEARLSDEALAEGIRASGFHVLATPTFMRTPEDRLKLARSVLEFARAVRLRKEIAADA